MLNQQLFAQMFAMLCEVYNRQQTKPLMDGYYLVLKQMSDEDFKASILSLLEGRTFQALPKPAEILEYAKPQLEAIASLALQDVERAFAKAGRNTSLIFDDVVVHGVIEAMGGWVYLCGLEKRDWEFKRKDFSKLYIIHAKRDHHPEHVAGLTERTSGMAIGQTPDFTKVKASYVLPKVKKVKALNAPVNNAIALLAESKKMW